jgi:hypothetical protein
LIIDVKQVFHYDNQVPNTLSFLLTDGTEGNIMQYVGIATLALESLATFYPLFFNNGQTRYAFTAAYATFGLGFAAVAYNIWNTAQGNGQVPGSATNQFAEVYDEDGSDGKGQVKTYFDGMTGWSAALSVVGISAAVAAAAQKDFFQ